MKYGGDSLDVPVIVSSSHDSLDSPLTPSSSSTQLTTSSSSGWTSGVVDGQKKRKMEEKEKSSEISREMRDSIEKKSDEVGTGLKRSVTSKEELDHIRKENEWSALLTSGHPPFLLHTSMHVTVSEVLPLFISLPSNLRLSLITDVKIRRSIAF